MKYRYAHCMSKCTRRWANVDGGWIYSSLLVVLQLQKLETHVWFPPPTQNLHIMYAKSGWMEEKGKLLLYQKYHDRICKIWKMRVPEKILRDPHSTYREVLLICLWKNIVNVIYKFQFQLYVLLIKYFWIELNWIQCVVQFNEKAII